MMIYFEILSIKRLPSTHDIWYMQVIMIKKETVKLCQKERMIVDCRFVGGAAAAPSSVPGDFTRDE